MAMLNFQIVRNASVSNGHSYGIFPCHLMSRDATVETPGPASLHLAKVYKPKRERAAQFQTPTICQPSKGEQQNYYWWFRNPKANHWLDVKINPCKNTWGKLPTPQLVIPGFLNHPTDPHPVDVKASWDPDILRLWASILGVFQGEGHLFWKIQRQKTGGHRFICCHGLWN